MKPILEIQSVSKKFRLMHEQKPYLSLRESLTGIFRKSGSVTEDFYVLNNISFEVNPGESIGIIGKNGAGKSTLLKILSRITPPSSGKIVVRGRIASLLEVGTGFHPELTGRENIFLNGSILGMRRKEIETKFDEIVDFSGTEKFLDTPLKHFSSGQQLRLAFSVAAFLEPEILVIDEVLAVGDAEFQKKCLGKMEDVNKSGRTILFVSHNMSAVQSLCKKCLLLEKGSVGQFSENVGSVINTYLTNDKLISGMHWKNDGKKFLNPNFSPSSFGIVDSRHQPVLSLLDQHSDYFVQIEAEINELHSALTVGYALYTEDGNLLYISYQTDVNGDQQPKLRKGKNTLRSKIPKHLLNEGTYRLELIGGLHFIQWILEPNQDVPSIYFEMKGIPSSSPYWMNKRPGILGPAIEWTNDEIQ